MDHDNNSPFRKFNDFRWDAVDYLPYKEEGSAPFRAISRQVLFSNRALGCEWRYFEMAPGGYSTLERHEHAHAVMILRGRGQALVAPQVRDVAEHDLISIPSWTWHQFRAAADSPLGFLCMVNHERDRPQPPDEAALAELRKNAAIATFLNG